MPKLMLNCQIEVEELCLNIKCCLLKDHEKYPIGVVKEEGSLLQSTC